MKKSLIALAVAGVVVAPAAFAATSNVDVYGKLHVTVSVVGDAADEVSDLQVSSNASRIGLKGSEDLGGGMKAIWQVESSVDLDEQSGTLGGRNSFVGLSGGFGTALIGNHDTPLKMVGRTVDLFGDTQGDSRNVLGGGADMRAKNVIAYISPTFSGFSVIGAYSNDIANAGSCCSSPWGSEKYPDQDNMSVWNVTGQYQNGPIYAGISYAAGDGLEDYGFDSHLRLAGSYAFGDAKVVAEYDKGDATSGGNDVDGWMVGGSYAMGPITLKANYATAEEDNVSDDWHQWNIGADYALSKRTTAYAMYTKGQGVHLNSGAGGSDWIWADASDDVSAFAVGVVHNF